MNATTRTEELIALTLVAVKLAEETAEDLADLLAGHDCPALRPGRLCPACCVLADLDHLPYVLGMMAGSIENNTVCGTVPDPRELLPAARELLDNLVNPGADECVAVEGRRRAV